MKLKRNMNEMANMLMGAGFGVLICVIWTTFDGQHFAAWGWRVVIGFLLVSLAFKFVHVVITALGLRRRCSHSDNEEPVG